MPKQIRLESYKAHPEGEQRRRALRDLIEEVLLGPLDDEYKRKVLSDLLWKYTEADGKWNTRHRSVAAAEAEFTTLKALKEALRHDHVTSRSELVSRLIASPPKQVSSILADAIACLVTVDEHKRLCRFDKTHPGWSKYAQATVKYHS